MKKTFAPEILRICYIAETKGEAEAVDLMVEYLLQYGNDLLANTPENMLFIARPAVAKANEILAERENAVEEVEEVEAVEAVEAVEVVEIVETEEVEEVETVETVEAVEEVAETNETVEVITNTDVDNVIAGLTAGNGLGALRAMLSASSFIAGNDYIQFKFRGCEKANTLVVRYDAGADLYNVEFIKVGTRDFIPYADMVGEFTGLFAWDLKEIFEDFTGLRTSL